MHDQPFSSSDAEPNPLVTPPLAPAPLAPAPLVTVVVCTFNRAAMLPGAVVSLAAQQLDAAFEILVVDNGSSDGTLELLPSLAERHPMLRFVRERQRGVSWARNRGIAEARGTWIAFFDDDQLADVNWLGELLRAAQEQSARCAGGRVSLLLDKQQLALLPAVCRGLLGESAPTALERYNSRSMPGTGNLLVHRDVFQEVGVFDTTLVEGGEDTDLFRRMFAAGIEAWHTPAAVVRHHVPPYRLREDYLRWVSRRIGWQLAKRERRERGLPGSAWMLAGRWAQAWLSFRPRLWRGWLSGASDQQLAGRCLLARWEGYRASALSLLGLGFLCSLRREDIDFGSERELFADGG